MTNLDSILKSRDITLLTKVRLVKAMVFPVVMYGCESWTVKKTELQGMDAFELWCWRRLLRVPWTARRSNQSILKEISPGCSLEGMMLKLKLQCFGYLMNCSTSGLVVHHRFPEFTHYLLMSIESVMPSSHLILCCPLLLLHPIPPSIRVFSKSQLFAWSNY